MHAHIEKSLSPSVKEVASDDPPSSLSMAVIGSILAGCHTIFLNCRFPVQNTPGDQVAGFLTGQFDRLNKLTRA